ncbi:Spy/CpxP family protein refolding chaperone [Gemmatimonas sp.]|jgi:protein CpxP|uniref:Spy/CpxP family protein refolding chaperone n=1 Tax=Gemmatimonas sp. TaxID=1962908 RepID=UPI0037BF35D4
MNPVVASVRLVCGLLAIVFSSSLALAQATPPVGQPPKDLGGWRKDDPRRVALERRFQERVERMVRERLQLTDEQAGKLRDVATRTEESRRALRRDEMQARQAMRDELWAGDNANEARISELLDQMPRLERRRLDLMEQELRELSKFLSPLQRARYFALQDELRRGMLELQRRRVGADSAADRPGNGPPYRRPPGGQR